MIGALLSEMPREWDYKLFNAKVSYDKEADKLIQKAIVCRRQTHLQTGEIKEEVLYENRCIIAYKEDLSQTE